MLGSPKTLLVAVGVALAASPAGAQAAAPEILNNTAATFFETDTIGDSSTSNLVTATFLVRHDLGRSITGIAIDQNYDGVDNTATAGVTSVTPQAYGSPNALRTSVVTLRYPAATPSGLACGPFSGTREVSAPVRYRAVVNTGERSAPVTATLHVVDDASCTATEDPAHMFGQTQNKTTAVPGEQITYSFACNDPDTSGANDRCARYRWRWRRLNDGATGPVTTVDVPVENTTVSLPTSFTSRGHYVVEAELGGEDGAWGDWFRIGNAVVNSAAASLSGSLAFPAAVNSSPPSVNAGANVAATATVADTDGMPQVIEWDATGDGAYERREFTVPNSIATHQALGASQLSQAVSTATPGLKTVAARMIDNGALDAADSLRRTITFSGQLRVNAIPVATGGSHAILAGAPSSFQLTASDADNQPAALAYEVVGEPAKGDVSCSTSGACTYTPDPGAAGADSFTFRARDGAEGLVAAWSDSNVATVTIDLCTMLGTAGDDVLNGTSGNDTICGLGGNDTLTGLKGHDQLIGGPGHDSLLGGKGNDTLDGGAGADIAGFYDSGISGVALDLGAGTGSGGGAGNDSLAAIEKLDGSPGDDTIVGDANGNWIDGRGGNDHITGAAGDDTLVGNVGDDTLFGNAGNDGLQPGAGMDAADGGEGGETYFGDVLRYTDATGGVSLDLASGFAGGAASGDTFADFESAYGSAHDDVIFARLDGVASLITGNNGDDQLFTDDADALDGVMGGNHVGGDVCGATGGDVVVTCP